MAEPQTFGELYKTKAILEDDLVAAVEAYIADQDMKRVPVGSYAVDIVAAIEASPFAQGMLADPGVKEGSKRSAVRTAILLARPVKP
jgi:hypothetical protein